MNGHDRFPRDRAAGGALAKRSQSILSAPGKEEFNYLTKVFN
jgi:hypothetical protein